MMMKSVTKKKNRQMKISHSDGLKAIESTTEYRAARCGTSDPILSFKKWQNIAAKKNTKVA